MESKKRILIVDDNNENRDILSEFFLIQGFEVETANNGLQALNLFFEYHFDALVTDFQMPCMDGLTLADEIRKKEPEILIIMMTGDILTSIQEIDLVDYVLKKPFRLNEIYAIVQGALEPTVRNCASSFR